MTAHRLSKWTPLARLIVLPILLAGCGQTKTDAPPIKADSPSRQTNGTEPSLSLPPVPPTRPPTQETSSQQTAPHEPAAVASSPSLSHERSLAGDVGKNETEEKTELLTHDSTSSSDSPASSLAEPAPSPAPSQDEAWAAERIMLLTPDGPLIVDLRIVVEGRPYSEVVSSFVDQVLQLADENEDDQVRWEELLGHIRFRYGQFGNPVSESYSNHRELIQTYDTTRNGRVDRDEVLRWVTSGQGFSKGIRLSTSNSRRITGREESFLRQLLDLNDDRILSDIELQTPSVRLQSRDSDNDEILFEADFRADSSLTPRRATTNSRSRYSGPMAAILLHDKTAWGDVRIAWEDLYRHSSQLEGSDLGIAEPLFTRLDLDANQSLSTFEFEMLTEVDPHLTLRMDLANQADRNSPPISRVTLVETRLDPSHIRSVVQHQSERLTMTLPHCLIDFYVSDRVGVANFGEQASQMLQQGDQDRNSYLDRNEYDLTASVLGQRWEVVDLDQNGMVYVEELTTVLEQRQAAQRGQIQIQADDQADVVFPILDENHDGRLDSREISRAGTVLRRQDQNGDGQVSEDELFGCLVVGVVRGAALADDGALIPVTISESSQATSRWFRGMDRNRDGTISFREFLGTKEQFQATDTDQDGFLSPLEAR